MVIIVINFSDTVKVKEKAKGKKSKKSGDKNKSSVQDEENEVPLKLFILNYFLLLFCCLNFIASVIKSRTVEFFLYIKVLY